LRTGAEAAPFGADIDFDPWTSIDLWTALPSECRASPNWWQPTCRSTRLRARTSTSNSTSIWTNRVRSWKTEHGAIDLTSEIDAEERALDAGGDRTLFDLFIAEARGHVATLRRELTRLHINPSLRPSQDSMLAAHTLGGISLTVDQGEISALAKALEHALNRCDARGEPPEADQSALLNNAASALEAQVAAIGDGAAAAPAPDLIAQLDRLFVNDVPAVRTDGTSGARTSGHTVRPAFRAGRLEAGATDLEWHEEASPEAAAEPAFRSARSRSRRTPVCTKKL
jgi:hypothetical protein